MIPQPLIGPREATPASSVVTEAEGKPTIMTRIGRGLGSALTGFARGMESVPAGTAYSPWLGGIAGGLAGIGRGIEAERRYRMEAEEPARAIERRLGLAQREEELIRRPAREEEYAREQAGRIELLGLKEAATTERAARLALAKEQEPDLFQEAIQISGKNPLFAYMPAEERAVQIEQQLNALRAVRARQLPELPVPGLQPEVLPRPGFVPGRGIWK